LAVRAEVPATAADASTRSLSNTQELSLSNPGDLAKPALTSRHRPKSSYVGKPPVRRRRRGVRGSAGVRLPSALCRYPRGLLWLLRWFARQGGRRLAVTGFGSGLAQVPDRQQMLDPLSWKIFSTYGRKLSRITGCGWADAAETRGRAGAALPKANLVTT
jgi:hypothetical protein